MRRSLLAVPLLLSLVLSVVPAAGLPADGAPAVETVPVEVYAEDGTMSWVDVELPVAQLSAAEADGLASGDVHALHRTGPSDRRFDLVIVGDGYTASEEDVFAAHAQEKVDAILGIEPFTSYAGMFNIWAVDVASPESGVDNDPLPGPDVATALDMEFWCNGIERLLCVDRTKAAAAAAAAPEVDHVLVLANSTKYGGAGGTIATSSGGNGAAALVTIHELGHSIGGLADEYEYYARAGLDDDSTGDVTVPAPGLSALPGQEPRGANITAAASPEAMAAAELKWFRWLGEQSPDGGTVGTFEGGGYSPVFIYRPTEDSLMHTLGIAEGGNLFNVVAIEELTAAFHAAVPVLRDASPARPTSGPRSLAIEVDQVGPQPFTITWALDGAPLPELDGRTEVTLDAPGQILTVTVVDPTPLVRDPALIEQDLTERLSWQL